MLGHLGMISLLTMIPVRENSEVVVIYPYIYIIKTYYKNWDLSIKHVNVDVPPPKNGGVTCLIQQTWWSQQGKWQFAWPKLDLNMNMFGVTKENRHWPWTLRLFKHRHWQWTLRLFEHVHHQDKNWGTKLAIFGNQLTEILLPHHAWW